MDTNKFNRSWDNLPIDGRLLRGLAVHNVNFLPPAPVVIESTQVKLRNVKLMSELTSDGDELCFSTDVYYQGKPAVRISSDGTGAPRDEEPLGSEEDFAEFVESLPTVSSHSSGWMNMIDPMSNPTAGSRTYNYKLTVEDITDMLLYRYHAKQQCSKCKPGNKAWMVCDKGRLVVMQFRKALGLDDIGKAFPYAMPLKNFDWDTLHYFPSPHNFLPGDLVRHRTKLYSGRVTGCADERVSIEHPDGKVFVTGCPKDFEPVAQLI